MKLSGRGGFSPAHACFSLSRAACSPKSRLQARPGPSTRYYCRSLVRGMFVSMTGWRARLPLSPDSMDVSSRWRSLQTRVRYDTPSTRLDSIDGTITIPWSRWMTRARTGHREGDPQRHSDLDVRRGRGSSNEIDGVGQGIRHRSARIFVGPRRDRDSPPRYAYGRASGDLLLHVRPQASFMMWDGERRRGRRRSRTI